jgi:polysaccharide biosynthesis protein PslG
MNPRDLMVRATDDAAARHRWPRIAVALLAVALLVGVGLIYSMTRPQPAWPHRFGISDPELITEPASVQTAQLAAMKAIGITSIRLEVNWDWVQYGGRKSFDWSQIDRVIKSVRSARMSVDLIIDGCPPWAAAPAAQGDTSPQPASPDQYATFAADVAARYGPRGVGMFEIWNEPNNEIFWQPRPSPAAYTADLKAAYAAIKKVDPSALVISGGLAPETNDGTNINAIAFLQAMYADGAQGSFDALGYHPYSYPSLPDTYEPWSGWSQMDRTSPSIRSVMARNGDASKPIWITEVGAPSSGPDGVGQAPQAAALAQAIHDAKTTSWIGDLYLYTWQDGGLGSSISTDWFGLLTARGTPKPAYTAVAAAIGRCGQPHRCLLRRA